MVTLSDAAVITDEFVLTHRRVFLLSARIEIDLPLMIQLRICSGQVI